MVCVCKRILFFLFSLFYYQKFNFRKKSGRREILVVSHSKKALRETTISLCLIFYGCYDYVDIWKILNLPIKLSDDSKDILFGVL